MGRPDNAGKRGTGIDIVAEERETAGIYAILSRLYEPDRYAQKADIDSFFTTSGKTPMVSRVISSTTDKWDRNTEMR